MTILEAAATPAGDLHDFRFSYLRHEIGLFQRARARLAAVGKLKQQVLCKSSSIFYLLQLMMR